jgi:hypothetical protein
MCSHRSLFLGLITVCNLATDATDLHASTSWKDVEEQVIQQRAKIKVGHLRIASQYSDLRRRFNLNCITEIYFDSQHLRGDVFSGTDPTKPPSKEDFQRTSCFRCWENERHVAYLRPDSPDVQSAIVISDNERDPHLDYIPDPRRLGFLPFNLGMQSNFSANSYVGSKNRVDFEISDDVQNGKTLKRIKWRQTDHTATIRMWVAPELGFSVVAMENDFENYGIKFLDRIDLEIESFDDSTLFFQKRFITSAPRTALSWRGKILTFTSYLSTNLLMPRHSRLPESPVFQRRTPSLGIRRLRLQL